MNRWLIRRELWEHRSITIAPLFVVSVFLLGFFFSLFTLPERMRNLPAEEAARQWRVQMPFSALAFMLIMTAGIVSLFYCLDALQGERRDRSLLFWKSLPVSDRDTVLSKAAIPFVVLPLLTVTLVILVHLLMLLLSTIVVAISGSGVVTLWSNLPLLRTWVVVFYGLIVMALWFAPLYAWLLFVSGWSRRGAAVWAIVPPMALAAVAQTFGAPMQSVLRHHVLGWYELAFVQPEGAAALDPFNHITPARFLSAPGLWIGLLVAALFIALTVRVRRNREPN